MLIHADESAPAAVVAGLLLAIIVWIAVRLAVRWRQGRFGSRLLVKLAAIFAVVGFLPGLLIYGVSYQFVSRSIEAWFDVKVEGALDAGLNLGRATLDTLALDLGNKTRAAALQLNEVSETSAVLSLERVRAQLDAEDVVLWASNGSPLATAGNSRFQLNPERPASGLMRQLRNQAVVTTIEGLEEALTQPDVKPRIKALATLQPTGFGLATEPRLLQVTVMLPPTLVATTGLPASIYSRIAFDIPSLNEGRVHISAAASSRRTTPTPTASLTRRSPTRSTRT